jgi:hypothetical protein
MRAAARRPPSQMIGLLIKRFRQGHSYAELSAD